VGKQRNEQFGRPSFRRDYNGKGNLKEMGLYDVEWIDLAQDG
jgi:hypothetical protein